MSQLPDDAWQTYKRLLSYVKPHALILFASVIGYAIYAATQAGAAQLAGYLGETVVNPEPHRVVIVSIAPFFIALAQGLGQFMGSYSMTWVAQEIVYRLRNDVFGHVLRLPQAEYNNNASGRIMSKIIFDAQQITSAGTDALIVMLREGLTVIGLLTFLLYQNWKLTLILLIAAPLVGLVVNLTSKRFRHISRRIQGSMGNITQFLGEAIEGNQAVKIFGGQKLEADRFHSVSRRFARQNTKLNASKIGSTVIVQLFVSVAIGAVTYLYITMMGEALTVGGFLSYIAAAGMIQKPLKQLTDVNVKIQRGVTGAASLFELMDRPEERDEGDQDLPRTDGNIEFRDVTFGYDPAQPVLRNLSLKVNSGETVALIGRSGAGKSTISAMLPRFFDPDQGQVLLDGVPLPDYKLAHLRRQIAMVSQKVVLFNDTVRHNIAYGEMRDADDAQVEQAARNAYAWDFIQGLEHGLDTEVGQDGAQLSGGQRQRIAIARALLKDAPILILDEATSALDTESEHHIQQALERLMEGRTTLVIAHRLSTIEKADRILVLDQGQLIEQGTHSELLEKNGLYTQLYKMDFADNGHG
ncbi:lipid A export permease/ATP-binding protein MsbA [Alloalcanivorax venustensis]|jgi:subfamily B ATP-binding cassette protein MsbA|uniref:LPS ABC transporter permease n=1 Tax=Alloalcanivorax venustensis ISO4 TaxID=1177184 RepID=A0ABS0AJ34_9GAMM|nr:lipid A export permease/ATP-binding protein MsbA [Alloalcanivorax venustensis]KXJ42484.1 MAG: lipid A export permease/ATP-binding protein MsbA [Alcanivorax sp. Nap_24]MAQ33676.1 lipid A export permease/ATP-binding protein MsbA [Alcanivorax sp.]MEA3260634.1 lipid A export permease/ATP-binding protein MsbA [Pseudomonadota bacterium]SMO70824.1 ATP-binding cassette, subfamily B, MsbA [Alcanivorax sp. DSM 26295]MBA4730701.1 lipid A export permease/ATP-binding protein MsbA [Alcanivorax sp.]|tara:strand:- start:9863 stop:11611 length:1749 start_codon:yes stop_codon:yes gene_type:complete